MRDLVRCDVCGDSLPVDNAVRVDEVRTARGHHWAWAHLSCAPDIALSTQQTPCATCAQEVEELRVVGPGHRNTDPYDGSDASCSDCGASWPPVLALTDGRAP